MKQACAWPVAALVLGATGALAQSTDPPKEEPRTVPQSERADLQKPRTVTPVQPQSWPETSPAAEEQPLPEDIRSRVLTDAARRAAVSVDAISIVSSQAVEWPDGSLGCPQPGVTYPQAPVAGYRVSVKAKERVYDYRVGVPTHATGAQVQVRLCDSPSGIRAVEQPSPTPEPTR